MAGVPASPVTGVEPAATTVPGSANSPANSPAFLNAANTVYGDLNSGNYTGAWNTALGTSSMFGTNMGAATKDPLLEALESSQGLQQFDPSKKWDQSSLDAYYNAFNSTGAYHGNNSGSNGYLGKNPYGLWGSASAITSGADQKANIAQEGMTPDVARFVGAKPSTSFLGKYGTDIAALALAVAAPYAIGAIAPMLAGGAAAGSLGAGLATAGAGAIYGAGSGALLGGISGGNIGKDALMGGIGGGIMGGASALGSSYGVPGAVSSLAGHEANSLVDNSLFSPGGGGNPGVTQRGGTAAGAPAMSNTGNINLGGQGNNGNMASTDTTLAGTITGALPGLLQAGATGGASMAGANAQVGALNNAITTQKSTLGNINSIWQPQQNLGVGADTSLGTALGTNGQPADYSGFENMPGYQFAVSQGTQAIQRQAAAMGNAYTPNTAAAVGQYVTGTASQDYNTYISQLMGAAGLGSTANTQLGSANLQTGENISGLQQNIGQAQAGGYNGVGSGVSGLFSPNGAGTSLIGAAGRYLNGGAGNGGGGGGNSGGGGGGGGGNSGGGSMYQGPLSPTDTGVGNGSFGSGYNPSTGQPWTSGVDTSAPAFDPNSVSMPTMPDISSTDTNFGGSLDFGSTDTSGGFDPTSFLGGW